MITKKAAFVAKGIWYFMFFRYSKYLFTTNTLAAYQQRQLKRYRKKTLSRSPYFKSRVAGPFHRWPLMNQSLMMEHFSEINTAGVNREKAMEYAIRSEAERDFKGNPGGITVGLSSGTSGNRGMFLANEEDRLLWVAAVLAKMLPPVILKKRKIALFLRANSGLYESVNGLFLKFKFFDLIKNLDDLCLDLQDYQASIIVAPASMLRFLAKKHSDGQIQLNPEKIISCAEVLDPLDQKYISDAFGLVVHQIYQCTEGFLGASCEYGTIHLNEDIVLIEKEFCDHETRKFSPVITDLYRQAQPMIRYQLNDILTLKESPCPCGQVATALEQIEGRSDDIFMFRSEHKDDLVPVFPDFIRRAVILSSPDILGYKVIQESPDLIRVSLDLTVGEENNRPVVESLVNDSLIGLLDRNQCLSPTIVFETIGSAPGIKKLKRVERLF